MKDEAGIPLGGVLRAKRSNFESAAEKLDTIRFVPYPFVLLANQY